MKNSTASNRKTGRMIAKNLIILVVLVFVAILAMWAWFTNNSSATADGIDVNCMSLDDYRELCSQLVSPREIISYFEWRKDFYCI